MEKKQKIKRKKIVINLFLYTNKKTNSNNKVHYFTKIVMWPIFLYT